MKKIIILAVAFLMVSPGLFAQWKAGKQDTTRHTALYSCQTHPNVITKNSGKCPCGMNLNLSQKEQLKAQVTKTYTCPVNADVVSNKAGRNLNLSLKEKMKMDVVKLNNNNPAHANVAINNSEKCPKCGMDVIQHKTKSKNG